jgi:hypothetical protein
MALERLGQVVVAEAVGDDGQHGEVPLAAEPDHGRVLGVAEAAADPGGAL